MNSYKLNSIAGHEFRSAICKFFGIRHSDIYSFIKDIDRNGVITLSNGQKFTLTLEEVHDKTSN